MVTADRQRADEALDWVRRIHDPAFADWDAHAAWLEADPRNLAAFDEASLIIADATEGLAPPRPREASPVPGNDNGPAPIVAGRRGLGWGAGLGAAIAAGLVAIVALPSLVPGGAQPYLLQTGAGERRAITLADGTHIALNGDSRVRLDHADPRVATVEQGEAFFTVRHDPARPFAVRAGGMAFQDIGTAFDVVHEADMTEVAVREGAVLYDPAGAAMRLDAGRSVHIARDGATVRTIDTAGVGAWRSGRLLYRDAPLQQVAGDVSRSIGQPIAVDPALAQRRFSGVLMIDDDRPRMFRRMAAVMGVEIRQGPAGWRMVPPAR